MKVHHIPCGPAVNESEHIAFEQIKLRLSAEPGSDEWILLTNVNFSSTNHRQSDEIDIITIGPPGIQIIEVKHWTAAWIKRNHDVVDHEAEKVTDKARRVGTKIRRSIMNLPRVDGVFLLTESASKVAALEDWPPTRGVPYETLKTWKDAIGYYARPVLSVHQIREIAGLLEPTSAVAVSGLLNRLAGYTHLELQSLQDQRFHRVFKAIHSSRQDRVLLHFYDLSVADESKAEEKAEREWKSLQRLQQYGWAPRIVDSYQDAPGYPGEIKFFTLADPAAPSIEERVRDDSWDVMSRLVFARKTVRALADLHKTVSDGEPTLHRNLTPNSILVKHDNSPILTGFEYARIPAEVTIASSVIRDDWHVAVPPEVRTLGRSAADQRSDIYSLCVTLETLFQDQTEELNIQIAAIFTLGTVEEPRERPSLTDLDGFLSELLGDPIQEPPPPSARFWTEDQIVDFGLNSYRIVTRLGSGGVGTTFKVVKIDRKTKGDLGTYVAKVVHDEEMGRRVLKAYELAHSHLRHSALSTIFEVAPEWRENSFVALMTWVEGEPLGEYSGVFTLLPDDLLDLSVEALVIRWLQTACEALRVLHDNGLIHGDVSPRNIIVAGSDLVLTDYDCVTYVGVPATSPGTVLYCSPSFVSGDDAVPADDLYALAASFFHILFEREPFQYDGFLAKERGLNWRDTEREEYPLLAHFMDRATHPNPESRFASVSDALSVLNTIQNSKEAASNSVQHAGVRDEETSVAHAKAEASLKPSERQQNEVIWLSTLMQSYPASGLGNSETRGLDTEFAEKTYIETKLEHLLYHDIKERQTSLVILCGNAGDGKTALLQRLAKRLGLVVGDSSVRVLEGKIDGALTVRMNLDGSASWRGKSADNLLDEFLSPFQDGYPGDGLVHLLAINDGRLLEWVESVKERYGETELTDRLTACLDAGSDTPESYVRFVNLNHRSLVGGISEDGKEIESEFLDRLTNELYGGERSAEIWSPCESCSAQDRCEVYRASRRFGPGALAEESVRRRSRERLYEALQAVHLRGETHITMRELRAALVYILFGVHYCTDYHRSNQDSHESASCTYWDRAFSPRAAGRQGDVLRELPRFDPALEAQPQIDRQLRKLASASDVGDFHRIEGEEVLESLRRRAFFEWSSEDIENVTGDPEALGLSNGRHLRKFKSLVIDDENDEREDLIKSLCGGISRLEALPARALERPNVVPLRITPRTPTETALWIEKRLTDFDLRADIPVSRNGLERLHRQAFLVYRYRNGREEKLRLGADLFHLLMELSDGYQLGDVAADDTFAHLSIFVQRLIQEDHRRIFAWNPMNEESIFEIFARIDEEDLAWRQRLVIQQTEPEREIPDE